MSEQNNLEIFSIDNFQLNQNMFIEASAGTGKTYTIQNIVSKILCPPDKNDKNIAPIDLSKILIVTYTEKAVGELRSRIRSKVESEIETRTDSDEKNIFINALRQVDDAPIFTIHSFCQRALREFAYEANVPFSLSMASGDALENFVLKYYRDELPLNELFRFLYKNEIEKEKDTIAKLKSALEKYNADEKIMELEVPKKFFEDSTDEDLKNLTDEGAKHLVEVKSFDDFCKIEMVKKHLDFLLFHKDEKFTNTKTCLDFYNELKTNFAEQNCISFDGRSFQLRSVKNDEFKNVFSFFRTLKDGVSIIKNYFSDKLYFDIIPDMYQKWNEEKKSKKLQTFNDMIADLRSSICKNASAQKNKNSDLDENNVLLKKLRASYRYAIIDEFQDTNQEQWDIFKKIFLDSEKNNIIVVGDPKQSIYSFQGADLNVYRNAISEIAKKGKGFMLDTNYRSTNEMINACNFIFPNFAGANANVNPEVDVENNLINAAASKTFSFSNSKTPGESNKKTPAIFCGKQTEPIWISSKMASKDFAQLAVKKIIDCCSFDENGKTNLQIFDKENPANLRNVKFSDFAILVRTRSELPDIENEMKKVGIPFLRYKDSKLFSGKETKQWIAIFKSIAATDFASSNRKILSSILASQFFHYDWKSVSNEKFENPKEEPLSIILEWQQIARERKWAVLQERIYSDTKIEEYLSSPTTLQELAKFKQIGTYAFNFLYEQNASLEDVIQNLENCAVLGQSDSDGDDNLVERASDFDSVQIMTIHASKGLEFPVVIVNSCFKGYNNKTFGPYLIHQENSSSKLLGFSTNSKAQKKKEDIEEEWFRLFYVAYTRASSLMILPYTEKEAAGQKDSENLFYKMSGLMYEKIFAEDEKEKNEFVKKIKKDFDYSQEYLEECSQKVKLILQKNILKSDENDAKKKQQEKIKKLSSSIFEKTLKKYSYSSLNKKNKANAVDEQDNIDGTTLEKNNSQIEFDSKSVQIISKKYEESAKLEIVPEDFPAGAMLGNAIHKVFELYNFSNINNFEREEFFNFDFSKTELLNEFLSKNKNVAELFLLVRDCLIQEGFSENVINKRTDWIWHIIKMVFNTLTASLPKIKNAKILVDENQSEKTFSLKDLKKTSYKSELEFNLNASDSALYENYVNGFIDLMFVQKSFDGESEKDVYSILDWKSDKLDSEDEKNRYADFSELKNKIDEEYSIQRVLYSYFLIQWLKQFSKYSCLTEEEIFQNHFGGIYYALVRGTKENTQNGIYVQTWNSFSDLKEAFEKIKSLMKNNFKA